MQLEETVSKGDSNGKFIFPPQRVKSRQEGQLLAGGLLDLFGLFFPPKSPSLWEHKVLFFLSAKPKVGKFKIWFKFFDVEKTK